MDACSASPVTGQTSNSDRPDRTLRRGRGAVNESRPSADGDAHRIARVPGHSYLEMLPRLATDVLIGRYSSELSSLLGSDATDQIEDASVTGKERSENPLGREVVNDRLPQTSLPLDKYELGH